MTQQYVGMSNSGKSPGFPGQGPGGGGDPSEQIRNAIEENQNLSFRKKGRQRFGRHVYDLPWVLLHQGFGDLFACLKVWGWERGEGNEGLINRGGCRRSIGIQEASAWISPADHDVRLPSYIYSPKVGSSLVTCLVAASTRY